MARIHRRTVQKDLHDPDKHEGTITHTPPDTARHPDIQNVKSGGP